jgi:oligosaccharyltransferase complex subunit gamma
LATKSKGNIITLDDATYGYYAATPRPYSLVVFLTAAHPKFKCAVCKQIDQEMALVAQAYTTSCAAKNEEPSLFFVRLDYESAQKTFNSYGVSSVPVVFHLAPSVGASGGENSKHAAALEARDKYQVPAVVDAEGIAGFVRDRTGLSVEIKRSMIGSYILLLIVFGILAALVRPVINSLDFWLRLIRHKSIWMLVSAGVYTCAISGMIFDIIRSPPM